MSTNEELTLKNHHNEKPETKIMIRVIRSMRWNGVKLTNEHQEI